MGFEAYRATGGDGWDACSLSGRAAIGYDYGCDGQHFYLGLALEEKYPESSLNRSARTIWEEGRPSCSVPQKRYT